MKIMGKTSPTRIGKSTCHVGTLAETFAMSVQLHEPNRFTDVDITEDCTIAAAAAAVTAAVGKAIKEVKASAKTLLAKHQCTGDGRCSVCTQKWLQHAVVQCKATRLFGLLETVFQEGSAHFGRISHAYLQDDTQTRMRTLLAEFDSIAIRASAIHDELATIFCEHDAKLRAMRLAADAVRNTRKILGQETDMQ